jgi:riboflavin kinase/FMN adenylyltransferase
MQLIRGLENLHTLDACVVSIGNFDGVHLAHQNILQSLIGKAKALNTSSVVISFYPHPSYFFGKKHSLINSFREKYNLLQQLGVDKLLLIHFDNNFANLSAKDFIEKILIKKLQTKHIIVGDDFRFGKNASGNIEMLRQHIFATQISAKSINNNRISSSNIRNLLKNGNIQDANILLGYDFYLSGKVVSGKQLGKKIGVPTANINLKNRILPLSGVFIAKVIIDENEFSGVVNIGLKPTIKDNLKSSVEMHIFDFNDNIYGKTIKIIPKEKLRDEQKFNSIDDLVLQIKKDILLAKTKV